jgi:peptidoglycan/xylan/chitin deacetylase (PgdA/CDA1 family)
VSGISILMYHQMGDFPTVRLHRASYTQLVDFKRHLAWLHRRGASVMSMTDAMRALRGEIPIPERAVVLTFDDGYQSFIDSAVPALAEYGYPAIVYVLAERAGDQADWYAVDGQPTPRLMEWAQVRELKALGMEVGSHGLRHTKLAGLSEAPLRHEVSDSRKIIEDRLGQAVPHFCYPFGSVDRAAVRACAEAGYETAVTCQRGAARADLDPLALPRKSVRQGDGVVSLMWKLAMKNRLKGPVLRR